MSIRKGSRTIASSVPVTEWGSIDGTLADQADIKSALDSKAPTYSPTFTGTPIAPTAPIDTSNNQIATTKYVQDALLNAEANLPEQSGNAGKFLTTNGQLPSWANIPTEIPSQSGQSGKFLTTNGTSVSWTTITTLSSGNDISITNNAINYTGPKYYRLGTRSWTYAQWTQYCEKGVTANITPSYTVTGLKAGDLVSVEGVCTDRGNANVLAWGITNGAPAAETNNVSVTFLGLNIQNDFGLVHLEGAEEITGVKTITGDTILIKNKSTVMDTTTNPSQQKYIYTDYLDKNNVRMGVIGSFQQADGKYGTYLQAGNEGMLKIISDGTNVITSAPTPSSVTDNTTKIATTEWVINVLKALYPVGSIYISTQNSCPLSAFFGTWQIVGTKILTDIPAQLSSKGNGTAIGLYDGSEKFSFHQWSKILYFNKNQYGSNVGYENNSDYDSGNRKSIGLTTDATKSGIVTDTNATSLTVNLWQRTA